jgi:hypothetical protein
MMAGRVSVSLRRRSTCRRPAGARHVSASALPLPFLIARLAITDAADVRVEFAGSAGIAPVTNIDSAFIPLYT